MTDKGIIFADKRREKIIGADQSLELKSRISETFMSSSTLNENSSPFSCDCVPGSQPVVVNKCVRNGILILMSACKRGQIVVGIRRGSDLTDAISHHESCWDHCAWE